MPIRHKHILFLLLILSFSFKTLGQNPVSKPDTTRLIFLNKNYASYTLKDRIPFIKRNDYIENNTFNNRASKNSEFNLNESGTLSTALFGGNNQSVSLQSNLNLTLNGKIAKNTYIKAHMSDNNLSQQTVGYSQTLQEFENLFFEITHKKHRVRAGDFAYKTNKSPFLQAEKQSRGFLYAYKSDSTQFKVGTANSRGQFTRYQLQVTEGNSGPYLLNGTNGEQYIYVLPNSEKVYLNGTLLQYGLAKDYVLNYNTGEITFNARVPISVETRIQIEFEYNKEDYTRNILFGDLAFQKNDWEVDVSYLSTTDNKRSPKNLNISPDDIIKLSEHGDETVFGVAAIEVNYDPKKNLYTKKDSLGQEVWIFSVDSNQTLYQVQFSFVGDGNGDYVINGGISAQGNVFEWKAPVDGKKQGNYAPIKTLNAPKSLSNTTFGIKKHWKNDQYSKMDLAFSNEDLNLFSSIDDEDNNGLAARLENQFNLSEKHGLKVYAQQQMINKRYKSPNPIRNQENLRLWNLELNDTISVDELYLSQQIIYSPKDSFDIALGMDYLSRDSLFTGKRLHLSLASKHFKSENSYLISDQQQFESKYLRSFSTVTLKNKLGKHSINFELENNEKMMGHVFDTTSFAFHRLDYQLETKPFSGGPLLFSAEYRSDNHIDSNQWQNKKSWYFLQAEKEWKLNETSTLKQFVFYKNISSPFKTLRGQQLTTNLLLKNNWLHKNWKNSLNYTLNQGQEAELNVQFIEVPQGQGTHIWNDYNNNNIKEFNEFEIAAFVNEADHVMLSSPGRNFIKSYETKLSFNQTIRIGKLLSKKKAFKRMRIKTQYKIEQKVKNIELTDAISPFRNQKENDILSINHFQYYQLYWPFYKNNQIRYVYEDNEDGRLITYGLENIQQKQHKFITKFFPSEQQHILLEWGNVNKTRNTGNFPNRNFALQTNRYTIEHKWDISEKTKWTNQFISANKDNVLGLEKLDILKLNSDLEYKMNQDQFFKFRLSLVNNSFTGDQNTSVAYEMLEGLKSGNNTIWNIGWQKNLNKTMKLVLSYQGRKSNGINTIHTGQIQIRADL
ncbi:MAG: hypothetical protein ACPGSD_16605 [Flavobacteriales bacterium]